MTAMNISPDYHLRTPSQGRTTPIPYPSSYGLNSAIFAPASSATNNPQFYEHTQPPHQICVTPTKLVLKQDQRVESACVILENVQTVDSLASSFVGQPISLVFQCLDTSISQYRSCTIPILRAFIARAKLGQSQFVTTNLADWAVDSARFWHDLPYYAIHTAVHGYAPLSTYVNNSLSLASIPVPVNRISQTNSSTADPSTSLSADDVRMLFHVFFSTSKLACLLCDILIANDYATGHIDRMLLNTLLANAMLLDRSQTHGGSSHTVFYEYARHLLVNLAVPTTGDPLSVQYGVVLLLLSDYERGIGQITSYFSSLLLANAMLAETPLSGVLPRGQTVKRLHVDAEVAGFARKIGAMFLDVHSLDLLGGLMSGEEAIFAESVSLRVNHHASMVYRDAKMSNFKGPELAAFKSARPVIEQRLVAFSLTDHVFKLLVDCSRSYDLDWLATHSVALQDLQLLGEVPDQSAYSMAAANRLISLIQDVANDGSIQSKALQTASLVLALYRLISLPCDKITFANLGKARTILRALDELVDSTSNSTSQAILKLSGLARPYYALIVRA